MAEPLPQTSFAQMKDATRDDYQLIARHTLSFFQGLSDRVLRHLELLAGDTGGYAVDRLTHSLQSATRAHRDGRDEEYVVCALIHDIGDTLATVNHSELAAVILHPFVSEQNHWIVKHHGIFQGYYFFHHLGLDRDAREHYRGHEHFVACAEFWPVRSSARSTIRTASTPPTTRCHSMPSNRCCGACSSSRNVRSTFP
jgi:predicted HD phosphohydrolase